MSQPQGYDCIMSLPWKRLLGPQCGWLSSLHELASMSWSGYDCPVWNHVNR